MDKSDSHWKVDTLLPHPLTPPPLLTTPPLQDVLDVVEEEASAEEDSSEYEEYSDSEGETGPRLKPVFVRKYVSL